MTRSVIDNLPEAKRQQIIDALLAGESLRKVAGRLGISHVQVGAYKRKVIVPAVRTAQKLQALQPVADNAVSQTVSTVSLTRATIAAAPFVDRINKHRATVDAKMVDADGRTAASLISADLKGLELEARITGLLDGPSHVTVNNLAIVMSPKSEALEPAIDVHCEQVSDSSEPAE